jgi:hypothetical protein
MRSSPQFDRREAKIAAATADANVCAARPEARDTARIAKIVAFDSRLDLRRSETVTLLSLDKPLPQDFQNALDQDVAVSHPVFVLSISSELS